MPTHDERVLELKRQERLAKMAIHNRAARAKLKEANAPSPRHVHAKAWELLLRSRFDMSPLADKVIIALANDGFDALETAKVVARIRQC